MIIAVQRGMLYLKEQLENRGYKVVYQDEYSHPVDVLIHSGKNNFGLSNSFSSLNISNSIIQEGSNYGAVLEINANGKSIKDIETMIFCNRHNNTRIL